jgi:hypothetical protein
MYVEYYSIIKDSTVNYIHKYNLIRDIQHGFAKKIPCVTNLPESLEVVSNYVHRDLPVDEIFFGFQKAFDNIPHRC